MATTVAGVSATPCADTFGFCVIIFQTSVAAAAKQALLHCSKVVKDAQTNGIQQIQGVLMISCIVSSVL